MGRFYEKIKKAVSAREAAEAYGIRVNRSGMACCPFHDDRVPSMKLDSRYHCFGCGADGDVINLTALLFGLNTREAAEKLAQDFGISCKKWKPPRREQRQKIRKQKVQTVRFKETERKFYRILTDYYHLMKLWQRERTPRSPDEEWDDYFCEALQNMAEVEYVMDCFLAANLEEKIDIMNDYGRKVKQFEQRIRQYRSEEAGGSGGDDGSLYGDTGR